MNQVLEQHRQELIETFGLEDVAKDKQDELIGRIGEVFLKRLFLATIDKLGDKGAREYEELLDKEASVEEMEAFFEEKIPMNTIRLISIIVYTSKRLLRYSLNDGV